MTSGEDIRHHVKVYISVFLALMALTVVTVTVSSFELAIAVAVAVAMVVAAVKGSLVAAHFMHLKTEKAGVLWLLLLTAVFWVALMSLPVLMYSSAFDLR